MRYEPGRIRIPQPASCRRFPFHRPDRYMIHISGPAQPEKTYWGSKDAHLQGSLLRFCEGLVVREGARGGSSGSKAPRGFTRCQISAGILGFCTTKIVQSLPEFRGLAMLPIHGHVYGIRKRTRS
eukprot:1345060-Amorphochlora_amoeboformis.AAC.1